MEELQEDKGFEVREELMVSPNRSTVPPSKRLAHFLKPCISSIEGHVFELPSLCLSHMHPTFEPRKWPLSVNFHGWVPPQKNWRAWVEKMAALHESTWEKAGIREAIFSSKYEIKMNYDLVIGLAEKWCPETKSFIFSWGEATITLEDVMIAGYSVVGSPVSSPLETDELIEAEEKLNHAKMELQRGAARKACYILWLKKFMNSGSEIEHEAFIALWLSRFVFKTTISAINKTVFPIAVHLTKGSRIALGPAILAHIYSDLNLVKHKIVASIGVGKCGDLINEQEITIWSPFQLIQIWAWERFRNLRPEPRLIKNNEPRYSQWDKLMKGVENARIVLDSAQENFDWRPYARPLKNWKSPLFYGEEEVRVVVKGDLSEELQAWDRCLRISDLVGLNCVEHYFPHRVAMQFGMDQDLPASVGHADYYSKPISYTELYIPSRHYEAGVTSRYLKWWKKSLLRLLGKSNGALPQKIDSPLSRIISQGSQAMTGSSFTGFITIAKGTGKVKTGVADARGCLLKKDTENVETLKEKKTVTSGSFCTELQFKRVKEPNDSPFPPGFPPKTNMEAASDSADEDNLPISEFLKSRMKHDIPWREQISSAENVPDRSETFSSTAKAEGVTLIELKSTTDLADDIVNTEPMKDGSEKVIDESIESKFGNSSPDVMRIQDSEGYGNINDGDTSEGPLTHLEEWVNRLEKIVAKLKAERFGNKSQP